MKKGHVLYVFLRIFFFSNPGGLRLGSDFETDSEIEQAVMGSSKKMTADEDKDDFDFYD